MPLGTSRREFLGQSGAALVGFWVATSSGLAQPKSPAEKLNLGFVGVRGRARDNVKECSGQNVAAICDVDDNSLGQAAKDFPKAKTYNDWRKMLEQKDLDGVVISTPDHLHAHATMAALRLGKHVYCEKPLTHSVWECRQVREMAAKMKVATQMGTQIHAVDNYRRVVELLQAGAIGAVKRIHVWVPGGYSGGERPKENPPCPPNVHWDLWLGPAAERPYNPAYHPFHWRGWWDFGGGTLSDMACHHMDLSHWAFGLRYPQTVEAEGPEVHPECTPKWLVVHFRYPARGEQPPIHLTWYNGDKRPAELSSIKTREPYRAGSLFIGEKGMLIADYGRHDLLPAEQFASYKRPEATIPRSIGHHNEWIKACKEGTPTTCNFDYSGALTETVLLGNVAYRCGKKLEWDGVQLKATNAPEAEQYLKRAYRKGWEL